MPLQLNQQFYPYHEFIHLLRLKEFDKYEIDSIDNFYIIL